MVIEWNCGCQFCIPGKWRRRRSVVQWYLVFPRRIYQENTFLSFGLILVGENSWTSKSRGQLEAAASVLFTSSSPEHHHYLMGRWFLNMFTISFVLNNRPPPKNVPYAKLNRGCLSTALLYDVAALIKHFSREIPSSLFPSSEIYEALLQAQALPNVEDKT